MPPKPKKLTGRVSATGAVEELRQEVYAYHVEVSSCVARLEERLDACTTKQESMHLTINGADPPSTDAPGLKSEVLSLLRWRDRHNRVARWVVHVAWVGITGILGVVAAFWKE